MGAPQSMNSQMVQDNGSAEQTIQADSTSTQPQQADPRFKDETVRLYGRTEELYLKALKECPEKISELWEEGWEENEGVSDTTRAIYARSHVERFFFEAKEALEKAEARQRYFDSPEYKAELEKARLRQQELEKEQADKREFWFENQRRRRQQDALLPFKKVPNERELNYAGQEYAHEFYQEFFSQEFMGYAAQYDSRMRGYRLPEESGFSNLLFHLSGAVYDQEIGEEWEERQALDGSGHVRLYGTLVCGYPTSEKTGRFRDLNDFELSRLGFAAWLNEQIGERVTEKKGLTYGTPTYWDTLFEHVSVAFFNNDLQTLKESPRTLFKLVTASINNKEVQQCFSELKNEKTFNKFLLACIDGGKHAEKADDNENCFFTVKNIGRIKVEKLEITFSNPAAKRTSGPTCSTFNG